MPFATGDQERIADIFGLSPEQYRANSELAQLMSEAETNDTAYSTDLVGKIRSALDTIDALNASISSNSSNDGVSSISINNQYSRTYRPGGSATASFKADKQGQLDLIRKLLDPRGVLEQFSQGGRVVRTL
ncbi:MAG: hypothetical protein AAF810_17340 [Cyanobacteria bacterium P01_D01_bin.36]